MTLGRRIEGEDIREVPYLRVANVKDGHLDLMDVATTLAATREIAALSLRKGDLLLTEGGDADKLGRGTIWEEQIRECIHQNHIFRVRFGQDFEPAFVAAQIGASYGKAYFLLRHAKQTTGIATINQRVLKAFPLMVPRLTIQREIVESLREQTTATGSAISAARAELDAIIAPKALCAGRSAGAFDMARVHKKNNGGNGNGRRHTTQASVDQAVKSICDIMRRGNCAGAMQYVPELTWILFLRILTRKSNGRTGGRGVGRPVSSL